jgi:hypothetical protein
LKANLKNKLPLKLYKNSIMKLSKTHVRFRAILKLDIVCLIFDFFRVLGGSL